MSLSCSFVCLFDWIWLKGTYIPPFCCTHTDSLSLSTSLCDSSLLALARFPGEGGETLICITSHRRLDRSRVFCLFVFVCVCVCFCCCVFLFFTIQGSKIKHLHIHVRWLVRFVRIALDFHFLMMMIMMGISSVSLFVGFVG